MVREGIFLLTNIRKLHKHFRLVPKATTLADSEAACLTHLLSDKRMITSFYMWPNITLLLTVTYLCIY